MSKEYFVTNTSNQTADIGDLVLADYKEHESNLTRRTIRAQLVENSSIPEASVRICVMHQRRKSATATWQDTASFNLASRKAGEEAHSSCRRQKQESSFLLFKICTRFQYDPGIITFDELLARARYSTSVDTQDTR